MVLINTIEHLLFSQADIRTRCIEGYSKHSKYEPGDQLAPADRSSWTAVLVDNTWRLLDINWSSKYVSGERHEDWKLIDDPVDDEAAQTTRRAEFYQHDETYFLTSPEVLVYSHLPDDERWQLLARPVTRQEFVSMAHLSGHFFRYGLRLASHRQCEVWAKNGEVTIKLGLPSGAKYKFAYRLWVSTRDKRKMAMYKDTALKRYVFMYHANGLLQCKIQFPVHGKFKLELSCLDRATTPAEQHYTLVCAYIINVYQAKKDVKPLPENNRDEWGPGCDLDDVGINPVSHTDGAAQMDDAGEIAMAFVARKDIEFLPTLHSNGRTKEQMHDYMCYGIENGRIAINAKAPEAGQYALNLYARQRGAADDSGSMPNVCSYLLFAPKPAADPTPFPAAGLLWASDAMVRLGVQTVSHPSAYVKLSSTDRADFVFGTPVDRDFMASLTQHRNDAETDMEEFCMVDKRIDKVTIRSRFPSSGLYKLDVFGKDIGQGSATTVLHDDSFAHIFTYVIAVDRQSITDPCCPFPEVFGEWTEYGCELHEPEFGSADLYAGSTVSFSVRVPTAKEVVFIRQPGDHWMPLTCGNTGLWIGNLETGEAGDEVQLSAKFDDASTHFSTLMIFKVGQHEYSSI